MVFGGKAMEFACGLGFSPEPPLRLMTPDNRTHEEGNMRNIILILIGGGLGSVSRYVLSTSATRIWGDSFPWGTLLVNLAGCFVIGFVFGLADRSLVSRTFRIVLITGFLGGFTTFSSFSLESVRLMMDREFARAFMNLGMNVLLGMLLTFGGLYAASKL